MASALLHVSRPSELVWQIALNAAPDNRLSNDMLKQLGEAFDQVELEWRKQSNWKGLQDKGRKGGALVITSDIAKFFSNGLNYEDSLKNKKFHPDVFSPVMVRLLTFPLVTIAAINGHAFAGGFMLALCCDFRLMTDGKAWACMNEIDFGAPFPPFFASVLATKLSSHPNLLRDVSLGKRFTAPELLKAGIVDEVVGGGELRKRALALGEDVGKKSAQGSWGAIKEYLYKDAVEQAKNYNRPDMPNEAAAKFMARMKGKDERGAVQSKL